MPCALRRQRAARLELRERVFQWLWRTAFSGREEERICRRGLVVFQAVCYTVLGLRNAAKGGAPWRHAQDKDDKNQNAREPVFQAERVPGRADRTLSPMRQGHQHLRESHDEACADAHAFSFARTDQKEEPP